ncbi:MAG: hypothetical protein M1813_008751 [Trichoglossum hirsutum]|nr:MAG: hypothetical protein M1813_008751 [Trichoglossum hirsutum]
MAPLPNSALAKKKGLLKTGPRSTSVAKKPIMQASSARMALRSQDKLPVSHADQSHPDHAHPDQAHPAQPHSAQSHLAQSHSVQSHPDQSHPVQSHSAQSRSVQPRSGRSRPVQSHSVQPHPDQSHPVQSHSAQSRSVQPRSGRSRPVQPRPDQSRSIQSHSVQSHSVQSHPIQSHPVQSSLASPVPVPHAGQSHPIQSSPISPAPVPRPTRMKRKRSRDLEAKADKLEDERPIKLPRRNTRHRPKPPEEELTKDTEAEADKPKDERPSKRPLRNTRHHLKPSEEKLTKDAEAEADKPKDERPSKRPRRSTRHHLKPSEEKLPKDAEAEAKAKAEAEAKAKAKADKPEGPSEQLSKQPRSTRHYLKPSEGKSPKDAGAEAGAKAKAKAKVDKPEGPSEQPQEPPLLSENDSRSLQSIFNGVMTSAASSSLKRAASHRSRASSETGTGSTNTNAVYRRKNLAAVKIRLHAEPPGDVETTIKSIVNTQPPLQRQAELRVIAREFRDGCLKNVKAQSGEDDSLAPLYKSILALCPDNLCIHEKAAWREELKPVVRQQLHYSSGFMAGIQQLEVDDASVPLQKRQQKPVKQKSANENHIPPEPPMVNGSTLPANILRGSSTMPPPAPVPVPEKEDDRSPVKTPHPDLLIGIDLEALISALSSQGLEKDDAAEFIDWLQDEMVQHEPDRPLEPMLLLVPAPRALDLAFPFAVVEGKAYSTGKQIFEAENQAAVSMACAHNLLHCLDRMADRGTTTETQPRVLFSITTQGPIHELWAHWTVVKGGVRVFESKLWDSWNGLVLERAEDFIVKLNSVCLWGTGPFLKTVVEPLGKVARKAREAAAARL